MNFDFDFKTCKKNYIFFSLLFSICRTLCLPASLDFYQLWDKMHNIIPYTRYVIHMLIIYKLCTYNIHLFYFFQKPFICGSLTWTHGASLGLFQKTERLVLEPYVKFYPNPHMMLFYYKNYGFETITNFSHQLLYLMPPILGPSIQAALAISCPWAVLDSLYWVDIPSWTWSSLPLN